MSKIISVQDDIVKIGTDNGGIKEVRREDVSFEPKVGDKVEVFENETSCVVTKVEEVKTSTVETSQPNGGVNININNTNSNANTGATSSYEGNGKKVVNKTVYLWSEDEMVFDVKDTVNFYFAKGVTRVVGGLEDFVKEITTTSQTKKRTLFKSN